MVPHLPHQDCESSRDGSREDTPQELFLRLPVPAFLIELSTLNIVDCSESACAYFAADTPLAGSCFLDLHDSDKEKAAELLKAGPVRYSATLAGAGGEKQSYEIATAPVTFDGKECLVAVVSPSVTEKQRIVERELRMSEERNRALVENATDVIYTHDLDGNFTSVSPAARHTMGYSDEEALGMNLSDVVAPEFLEIARERIRRKLRGEPVGPYEMQVIKKNGDRLWVEVGSRVVMKNGQPVGVQGIARDITDRKRTEEALRETESRFRAVADTAASAILICQADLFVYVNAATERITGYSAQELAKMHFWEIVHPEFRDLIRIRGAARQAGNNITPNRYEFKILTKSGEDRWLDFTAGVIPYGGKSAVLGTGFDITERKRAEQELQVQKTHLEELFQTAPEGIVVLDQTGRVERANREFLAMFGFDAADITGKEIDRLVVPESLAYEAADLMRSMNAGKAFNIDTVRQRKDGSLIEVSVLAKPLNTGGSRGRFVIYRDISQNRRADRAREVQFATTRILSESSTLQEAKGKLLETIAVTLGWDYARCWNIGDELECTGAWHAAGLAPLKHWTGDRARCPVVGEVGNSGEAVWIADTSHTPCEGPNGCRQQTNSLFAFPIRVAAGVTMVFEVLSRTTRPPDFQMLKALTDIGTQIGQFIDRRNAERAVVESEAKFRAVADTAASAIYIIAGTRLLYVNRATELITGYTREELMSMNAYDIVYEEDRLVMIERADLRAQGHDLSPRFEFRVVTRSGELRWVDYSASPIVFGGEIATLGTAFDITDRKRAEQMQSALYRITALANGNLELPELYKGIHEIVGQLMYAHNFYIALLDEEHELIEFPYFVDEEDPAPPPPMERSRGLTDYVLRTGMPLFADPERFEDLVASGEVVSKGAPSIDWLGVPLKSGDKTFGVLAVQSYSENIRYGIIERDILTFVSHHVARAIESRHAQDALAQSEARYRSQVQSAIYGLYRSSIDGKFLDVNPALVQMLGYDSAEQLLAVDLARDIYAEPAQRARLLEEIGEDRTIKGVEAQWKRKDGRVITVRLSGRGGLRYANEPPSFEMIAEDVTERRLLEDQLRHSQKMEAVGRLAGGVAHDFNNLLTVIKGYSDLMLNELRPGDRLRNEVDEIRRAADRAAALTRQLLAFSRRQVLEPRLLDLNQVVNNMDRMVRRLLGDDVELHTSLDPHLGSVKADPGQIEQVLMNLAVNARDAMPTGGRLTVETRTVELDSSYTRDRQMQQAGQYAMLAVSDTGIGMEPEVRSRIFEPFFTTKDPGKGTGLGLSTVYGIVQQSGGHISCYSEVGKGTCFKIYLPVVAGTVTDASKVATPPSAQAYSGTETILLIEDEDGVRALVRDILQRQGYNVLETHDGAEAMAMADRHQGKIDLLLSDVVLAHMSGREIAKQICAKRQDMRVLFISGYTEEAIVHHGVLEPGTAFLQKPFTPAALIRKVREVIDGGAQALAAKA